MTTVSLRGKIQLSISLYNATSAGVEWEVVSGGSCYTGGDGLLAVGQLFGCHQSKSLGTDHALKAVFGLDYKYLEDTIKILKALRD